MYLFFYFFRYVLSAAVIGGAYTLLVLPFTAIHVAQERRIGRDRRAIALLVFTDVVRSISSSPLPIEIQKGIILFGFVMKASTLHS